MSRKGRKKGRSGRYRQPVRVTGTGAVGVAGTPTPTRSVSQARVGGDQATVRAVELSLGALFRRQALLALPRQVWSNVVNFGATSRAMRLWARHLWTGRPIAWDKTGHVFPSEAELRLRRGLPDDVPTEIRQAREVA